MKNLINTLTTQTEEKNKQSEHKWVLVMSSLCALIAAHFVSDEALGINFVLLNIFGITAIIYLRNKFQQVISQNDYLLMLSTIIISLFFIIRQSDVLYGLNVIALFIIAWIAFSQRYTGSLFDIPMIAWLMTPFRFIHLCVVSSIRSISIGMTPTLLLTDKHKQIRSVVLGIIWTLPILLLFGSLLMSSDSRFEHFAMNIFSFNLSAIFEELLSLILYFPLFSALFYATILGTVLKTSQRKESTLCLEGIEILTVLTLINILFISYITIQFSYFFGGEQIILEPGNQTYSSYARRGFWELIVLAMLVLPLLLIAHWLQRNEASSLIIWFNRAATLMVICLVIIETSAIHRMYLYVKIYDLTELRFYSSVFMLYMMTGLIVFYLTVLKNKREQFILVMSAQTIIVIFILNIINPDAQISDYNMSHNPHRNIDIHYLNSLSTDAYPSIYKQRNSLNTVSVCQLKDQLKSKLKYLENQTEQWNWSIYKAHKTIELWEQQCQIKTN